MSAPLRTLGLILALSTAAAARAQYPIAEVKTVTGTVLNVPNPKHPERAYKVEQGEWLWAGALIKCSPGASLTILYDLPGATPLSYMGASEVPIAHASVPNRHVPAVFNIAARSHAGNALLLAPESAAFRTGQPITLHWQAPPDISEVTITVSVVRGPVVWTRNFPARDGKAAPPELKDELARQVAAGKTDFRVSCARPDAPRAAVSSTLSVLSPAREAELKRELANCGAPEHPWYSLFRAATFAHFELFDDALREIEIVLAKPQLARDPMLLSAAANLFDTAGHTTRATALRASSETHGR